MCMYATSTYVSIFVDTTQPPKRKMREDERGEKKNEIREETRAVTRDRDEER